MDRQRLQSIAVEYPYVRGLVAVPAGLLFLVAALGNSEWGPFASDAVFVAAVLAIALACRLVTRHYDERFGRVTPSTGRQVRAVAVTVAGAALMVAFSLLLRSRASWSLDLPVNPIPAVFAALMLVYHAAVARLRAHHVVIWGSLLVIGLLPVWDGGDPSNTGLVLAGVAVMVNGVCDHLALVRALTPAARG